MTNRASYSDPQNRKRRRKKTKKEGMGGESESEMEWRENLGWENDVKKYFGFAVLGTG